MKDLGRIAAVMAALILAGCPTTGSTPPTANMPALGARQVSLPVYTPLYDQAAHLRSLVESGDLAAAAQLASEQWPYFEANTARLAEPLGVVARHLNAKKDATLSSAAESVRAIEPDRIQEWAAAREHMHRARALVESYADHPLLKADRGAFESAALKDLRAHLDALDRRFSERAGQAFASYDHFAERQFFDVYPTPLKPREFLEANVAALEPRWAAARSDQLLKFAKIYPAEVLGANLWKRLGSQVQAALVRERAAGNDLRGNLAVLQQLSEAGFPADSLSTLTIAFVEVTSLTLLKEGQIQFPAQIEADLPAKLSKSDLDDAFRAGSDSNYVIVFDVALAKASRKVTGVRKMPSKFVSGRRTETNPEYNLVQNELNIARQEVTAAMMNKARVDSQYCYGLGCIGKAAGQVAAGMELDKSQANVQALMAKLRATPMSVERPIFQDYRYDLANVDARKVLTVNYYVIDRRNAAYFKSTFDIEERKKFEVAYQLQPSDPSKQQHERAASREKDVVEWEEAPSAVKLSQLVDHYLANPGAVKKLPAPEQLRSEMLQDKNLALARYKDETFVGSTQADPRFDSVVVVYNPDGGLGSGFFVTPDLVMTNYHVVEERDFVELKLHGGAETFGKVVARDVRLDLALIRVQSRGKPVQFFTANKLDLGSTIEVIGHPRGLEFSITRGVVSAIREMQNVNINDSRKVLSVQVDAAISSGNSGGPVFVKDRVVGVVSFSVVDEHSQNLNFTVHYSEVLRFIKESTNVRS